MTKSNKQYRRIKYQITHDSKILFVGTNPSPGSYHNGVPFSHNKSFWYLLNAAGLIAEKKEDLQNIETLKKIFMEQFTRKYHLGLINLVYRPTKNVVDVKRNEADPGRIRITAIIKRYKPKIVTFVGKGTYQLFSKKRLHNYGWQPSIASSKIFVMHSPLHGLARTRINELKKVGKAAKLLRSI